MTAEKKQVLGHGVGKSSKRTEILRLSDCLSRPCMPFDVPLDFLLLA